MKKLIYISLILCFAFNACTKQETIKLIPVKTGDKWGYIDKDGKIIINPQFDEAHLFRNGLALVKSNEGKFGFINEEGKYVVNAIYKYATSFSDALACVVLEDGKPQYINTKGEIVIISDASQCGGFSEGLAPVKIKGKWGYIDKSGVIKIIPAYDEANRFSEGLAAVAKIDEKTKEKKWGFIDTEGGIKIDFQFVDDTSKLYSPTYFSEGLAFVSNDGKNWGYINKEGKFEINPQFEGAANLNYEYKSSCEFKNGLAPVKQGTYWGFIDKSGKFIINPQFMAVYNFTTSGIAAVQSTDKRFGFIDKDGKYIINPQFDDIKMGFESNFAIVTVSDKCGIIDKTGHYTVNPQYENVWICSSCWIHAVQSDYIDKDYIAQSFFENTDNTKFRNISPNTTLKELLTLHPKADKDDFIYKLLYIDTRFDKDEIIADILYPISIYYSFETEPYSSIPVYKKVQRYNYWYGYYYANEVDHYDKKYNDDAKVSSVNYSLYVNRDGKAKSQKISEGIKDYANKKIGMSIITTDEIKNTDEKGMHLLKNDNMFLNINYECKKDKKDEKNFSNWINISVYFTNIKKSFDELEKSLIEDFNSKSNNDDDIEP